MTGASGQLGRQLVRNFSGRRHEVHPLTRADGDLTDPAVGERIVDLAPDVVVNSAAWTDVDGCARDPERARLVNAEGAGRIAAAAAACGARVVHISTNEVFDGSARAPYRSTDEPNPINAYGRSKLEGERAVAAATPDHLIVRTAWLFGPGGTNFVTKILAAAHRTVLAGARLRVVHDEIGNPTWTPTLAETVAMLAERPPTQRIVHAVGTPAVSRLGWARVAFDAAHVAVDIEPVALSTFERASAPPLRAVLAPTPGLRRIDWQAATRMYVAELRAAGAA